MGSGQPGGKTAPIVGIGSITYLVDLKLWILIEFPGMVKRFT